VIPTLAVTRDLKTPLRLTREQNRLLETAAEVTGQSKQAFIETAVFNHVDEVLERRERISRVKSSFTDDKQSPVNTGFGQPTGFTDAIAKLVNPHHGQSPTTENETPSAQAPVVVNVGANSQNGNGSNAVGGDIIDRLASHIVAGRDFEQSQRMRYAVSVLSDSTTTEEERNTLAARLDEAVASKKKTNEGGIVKTARAAFSKLAHLLE
jgi:hypothetical protein